MTDTTTATSAGAETGTAVLELEDVTVRFGGINGLDAVSLTVGRDTVCGLIGPNGAGKTTLFDVISGVRRRASRPGHARRRRRQLDGVARRAHTASAGPSSGCRRSGGSAWRTTSSRPWSGGAGAAASSPTPSARRPARGASASDGVITAAALVMISVFGSFVLGLDPVIKLFGVGLSTAVLLDATVVRMLIVPATMTLLDRKAWWLPKRLDRAVPELDVEGEHLMASLDGEQPNTGTLEDPKPAHEPDREMHPAKPRPASKHPPLAGPAVPHNAT